QAIFAFFRIFLFSFVRERALADMRKDIYSHIVSMPMDFFTNKRVGELSSRITNDIKQIQETLTGVFPTFLKTTLIFFIGMGVLLSISAKLTMLMFSILPVIIIGALFYGKKIKKLARLSQDQLASSGTIIHEGLGGISSVKAYTNEVFEISRYA